MKEGSTLECETPPWYGPFATFVGRKQRAQKLVLGRLSTTNFTTNQAIAQFS